MRTAVVLDDEVEGSELEWLTAGVYQLFRKHKFPPEESENLTRETMYRVYKRWNSFRGEAQLSTWIFQIARNIASNEIRRRTSLEGSKSEELKEVIKIEGVEGGTHLEEVLRAERERILEETVQQLPPQMRRCAELRLYQGLKYREIAEILGVTIDTVKAHLFQARQQVRERLSSYISDFDSLQENKSGGGSDAQAEREMDAFPEGNANSAESEISTLYTEIRDLIAHSSEEPGLQEELDQRILRLRALQRQEAAAMRERFESRRRLQPGTGLELLDRIDRRLNHG